MNELRFSNFKISVRVLNKINKNKFLTNFNKYKIKHIKNFVVYRNVFVYIIFGNGFINITKISKKSDIKLCLVILKDILSFVSNLKLSQYKFDNSTASIQLNKSFIPIHQLNSLAEDNILGFQYHKKTILHKKIGIEIDTSRFPAAKIFTDVGTALIFANGKCVIVGTKQITHAVWIAGLCNYLINKFKD